MQDWVGATPLRSAVLAGVIGGIIFFVLSVLLLGGIVGAIVISPLVGAAIAWSTWRTTRKAFPDEDSTWASLDGDGKQAVARAFRTGEVEDDREVATAVLERVAAVRGTGKPIGQRFIDRLNAAESAATRIAPPSD